MKYDTARKGTLPELTSEVNQMVEEGWEIHGSPSSNGDIWCQAMVKHDGEVGGDPSNIMGEPLSWKSLYEKECHNSESLMGSLQSAATELHDLEIEHAKIRSENAAMEQALNDKDALVSKVKDALLDRESRINGLETDNKDLNERLEHTAWAENDLRKKLEKEQNDHQETEEAYNQMISLRDEWQHLANERLQEINRLTMQRIKAGVNPITDIQTKVVVVRGSDGSWTISEVYEDE